MLIINISITNLRGNVSLSYFWGFHFGTWCPYVSAPNTTHLDLRYTITDYVRLCQIQRVTSFPHYWGELWHQLGIDALLKFEPKRYWTIKNKQFWIKWQKVTHLTWRREIGDYIPGLVRLWFDHCHRLLQMWMAAPAVRTMWAQNWQCAHSTHTSDGLNVEKCSIHTLEKF